MIEIPTDPEALRADIARTRAELGDTAQALAAKADVKARAKTSAAHAADELRLQAGRVADQAVRPMPFAVVSGACAAVLAVLIWRRHR